MQKHSLAAALLAAALTMNTLPASAAPAENTAAESAAILSEATGAAAAAPKEKAATSPAEESGKAAAKDAAGKAATPSADITSADSATSGQEAPSAAKVTAGSADEPNPLVPYASYDEMCAVLGFRPLILPKSSGYELTEAFVIDGTTSDLRYTSRYGLPDQRAKFTVRTARKEDFKGRDAATIATALSGIYSVSWQPYVQDGMPLLLAEVSPTEFAACWTQGDYLFSCDGQGINRWDFLYNVASNLLDLTAHYYTETATAD